MMDPPSPIEQQVYVDIESVVNEGLSQLDPPRSGEKTKLCDQFSMSVDDGPLLLVKEGNSSVMVLMDGGKEKRKKGSISAKKPPKPPRPHPHRGFSLDAADEKLIKELAELAMIKRARIERMKALMQKKASKAASSSSNATLFAMLFTTIFFIIILLQGMSCRNSHGTFEGSPQTNENSLLYIQAQLNHSTHTFV
ncbi:uncharacterized protein LOC112519705 [Cynara cardunculus var. scolymus]|uniref:Transmembrane protein n=1 Tax=Cynara cardunculus var. scolymus TaxID=59895 RepID=A0A103XZI7_CYNCS|nr:uncharacterized protein LOC112519705 [Cynara cardunculus var. scolymus]XP_024983709.1 uncharacterized protein LOC112519705 [Cynara cardunculus var. scolymus]KVH99768.1 hypothetical protein Ccrd_021997 [Cynara cardunculus var. scolymus]